MPPRPKLKTKKSRSCKYTDTKAMRSRNTPSYVARQCPFQIKPGKKEGKGNGPMLYQAIPSSQRSRRTGTYRTVWKWVALA